MKSNSSVLWVNKILIPLNRFTKHFDGTVTFPKISKLLIFFVKRYKSWETAQIHFKPFNWIFFQKIVKSKTYFFQLFYQCFSRRHLISFLNIEFLKSELRKLCISIFMKISTIKIIKICWNILFPMCILIFNFLYIEFIKSDFEKP